MYQPVIDPNVPFQPEYQPVVDDLVRFIRGGVGKNLHSIYVYGSVANKCAKKGLSNLDVVVVTQQGEIENRATVMNSIKWRFKQSFPFVREISLQTVDVATVTDLENIFVWGFILRHLAVCVHGENLGECFGDFETNWEIAKNWNMDVEEWISVYRKKIAEAKTLNEQIFHQSTIAKKLLRASYSLIMYKDKRWFNHPIACGQAFLHYHPEKQKEVERLGILFSGKPVPKRSVIGFIDSYGAWLAKAYKKTEFKIG